MVKNPRVIIILGPAGSGKGTQAKLLVAKFKMDYFGSGESLRNRQKEGDFTAKKLIQVMNQGSLVPRFVISKIWIDKMEGLKRRRDFKGLVSDGSPRMLIEAQLFDEALEWYEWSKNVKVIFLNISKRESISRLTKRRQCQKCKRLIPWLDEFKKLKRCDKCGGRLYVRPDDSPKAIYKRLDEFKKEVMKVINYYKKQGKLVEVNGQQPIKDVFREIIKKIG